MQIFLLGYIIISLCEIFTVGWFPLDGAVRRGFTAVHVASIIATLWILMMNGAVGYQLIDDGTPLSIALVFGSAVLLFVGTGYIALDTGFSFTNYWKDTLQAPNQAYALYTLYQLVPLVFLVVFFVLEAVLVLRVLGETRPMSKSYKNPKGFPFHGTDIFSLLAVYLIGAAILFALGQIFQYVISRFICNGTNGAINGGLFATFFTLCSVVMIWIFWSSITEDDWPMPPPGGSTYT